ncbi:MAG: hypothetical protein OQK24_09890 [Magnetovibrio sp.]|nr:hypothetical protein [Magnetovibrio sp.]
MNPLSAYGVQIGEVLSKIAQGRFRLGFENSFQQIQNTVANRINDEIDRIAREDDTPRRLATLESEYRKIERNKGLIDTYEESVRHNNSRLDTMQENVTAAISAFSTDDDNTNLTADEVTTIEAKRDALIEDTQRLLSTVHPNYAHPTAIRDIKNQLATLQAMEPVVGVVDAEGSGSPSNSNRDILDSLNSLDTLISTAKNVGTVVQEDLFSVSLNLQAKLAGNAADLTTISTVELKRREEEIDQIKADYGNILRMISLSFEAQANSAEKLGESLAGGKIEPGSVMNLFS